jgi:ADP-ribose pyrophosphatase YjhB (NUDIX family)
MKKMEEPQKNNIPRWLGWAREIQALAQTGMNYATDDFNRDRYRRLMQIAAEITAEHAGLTMEKVERAFLSARGYATPKVSVRGAVFRGGKILLVQDRADGGWCMPGGWADVGEPPSAMVEREVLEESGLRVHAAHLVGVYDANREDKQPEIMHAYDMVFLCDDQGGEPGPSNETSAAGFFGIQEIPALSSARTSIRHLRDAFSYQENLQHEAVFD